MKTATWIVAAIYAPLFVASGYIPATLHHDFTDMDDLDESGVADSLEQYLFENGYTLEDYNPYASDLDEDGATDFAEWVLGTDPLYGEEQFSSSFQSPTNGSDGVQITMQLPDYFGAYAEVYGRTNLVVGDWIVADGWIPTYGSSELTWNDVVRTNVNNYFYMIFDATMDYDGDGYSDWYEYYISGTDDEVYDSPNEDGDDLPDFWELKLFGDILTQDGDDDSDGDGLSNNEELVWYDDNTVVMYSDPSLYDTDGEGLGDGTELEENTDPLLADTDSDTRDDALELLTLRTDPNNPDIASPVVTLD
jgi:flavodoxin